VKVIGNPGELRVFDDGSACHNGIVAPIGITFAAMESVHLRFSLSAMTFEGAYGLPECGEGELGPRCFPQIPANCGGPFLIDEIVERIPVGRNSASREIRAYVEAVDVPFRC
jgi:hypothetical protein